MSDRAILAPLNSAVDKINDLVTALFTSEEHRLLSANSIKENDGDTLAIPVEYLNQLNSAGLPPHILQLKHSLPVILRNLNQTDGLCNRTRLIVDHIINDCLLQVRVAGTERYALLPRITLSLTKGTFPPPHFSPTFSTTTFSYFPLHHILLLLPPPPHFPPTSFSTTFLYFFLHHILLLPSLPHFHSSSSTTFSYFLLIHILLLPPPSHSPPTSTSTTFFSIYFLLHHILLLLPPPLHFPPTSSSITFSYFLLHHILLLLPPPYSPPTSSSTTFFYFLLHYIPLNLNHILILPPTPPPTYLPPILLLLLIHLSPPPPSQLIIFVLLHHHSSFHTSSNTFFQT